MTVQLVKKPFAMQETLVRFLGWEDLLEKGKSYPLQYSGLENFMDCVVHGAEKSQTGLSKFHTIMEKVLFPCRRKKRNHRSIHR